MRYEAQVDFCAIFPEWPYHLWTLLLIVLIYRYQIYGVGFNRFPSIEINKAGTIHCILLLSLQTFDILRIYAKNPAFKNLCLLASTTGSSTSISITYILFLTKLQKRQTRWNGFALLKNDITGSEPNSKLKINSRYQRFRIIKKAGQHCRYDGLDALYFL